MISFVRSLMASVVMGLVVYFSAGYLESTLDMTRKINQIIQVVGGVGLGAGVYAVFALIFKSEEAMHAWNVLSRRFRRKPGETGSVS